MWLANLRNLVFGPRSPRPPAPQRRGRLLLEPLEDRSLPSAYTAASVTELITDINAANVAGGSNTITLVAGTTFTLTGADNTTDGATGLPVIAAANDNLIIVGNGDIIQRSTAKGIPAFRLLDVAAGASLTLQNLTLQGGLAFGGGVSAEGGAVYNQGTLLLNGVSVQSNIAQGGTSLFNGLGQSAAGGAIYSNGSLMLQSCTIQNNQAVGGQGGTNVSGDPGGDGLGGGLYVAGGTVSLSSVTLSSNTAQGGAGGKGGYGFTEAKKNGFPGGDGGNGLGGGLYAAAGTVTLTNTTVDQNSAQGGRGGNGASGRPSGSPGLGKGGGLYIDPAALVSLDAFTQSHVSRNQASTAYADIDGSYSTGP
jgi:hypothetical protein